MRTRRNSGRTTISDVAALANVSSITVSRALRDPGKVSTKLRDRINQAVSELNYIPDPNARALASARTEVIGVIVPSLSNSVFSDVLRGIYEGVAGTNWHIQIGNSRYSTQEEERLVRLFIGQGPTALIVTGIDQTDATRTLLEKAACPVVQIMELTDTPIDMVVGFDHQAAAKDMVGHLVENGYRRIAAISARMDPRVQRRQESCRAALQEAGLYDPDLEISTDAPSSTTTGRQLVEKMLKKHPDIDAFFCHNDDLALGCLFACQAAGLRVPDDIGISGFNDMEFMTSACPPLTSITTHRFEMGKQAVDLALQTAGGKVPTRQIINLGYDLALRASTGRRYRL